MSVNKAREVLAAWIGERSDAELCAFTCADLAEELVAALEEAGFRVVPVEPTPEMLNAMDAAYFEGGGHLRPDGIEYALWAATAKAMLEAAR